MDQELKAKEKVELAGEGEPTRSGRLFVPSVDIFESEEGLTLLADIPGVEKEGLTIDLKDNTLTVQGTVTRQEFEGEVKQLYREYEEGDYYRQFTVSELIDQDRITAALKDGVLTLFLPKVKPVAPRRIEISAE